MSRAKISPVRARLGSCTAQRTTFHKSPINPLSKPLNSTPLSSLQQRTSLETRRQKKVKQTMKELRSPRWGYFRIITGTILGGMLGFYLMHRAEISYKEMWNERLRKYEEELKRKNQENASNEFQESI